LDFTPNLPIEGSVAKFALFTRAYRCILKIARTIADLEGAEDIATHYISEAFQYRSLDRTLL